MPGCTIFPVKDTRNNILTLRPGVSVAHYLTASDKPHCLPTYKQLLVWDNDKWISYNPTDVVGPVERTIPDASGTPIKQFGLLVGAVFIVTYSLAS